MAEAVPALVLCLHSTLEKLGSFEPVGFQFTRLGVPTGPVSGDPARREDLMYALPYLAGPPDSDGVGAVLSFDERLVMGGIQRVLLSLAGESGDTWPFVFGPSVLAMERSWVRTPLLYRPKGGPRFAPGIPGLSVRMPDWRADAVGWVLGFVSDVTNEACYGVDNFAIRLTKSS